MFEKEHRLQITKFSLYGLLKNLRFFEPFLLIYFLEQSLNLFYIGILFSIREIIIYVFEIPSGVIADRYGKKTELVYCFLFYIISFVLFYFATGFVGFVFAMALFALGEAFRSGTHKAMIMAYMDKHELKESKTKIYGLTRSYSLIGSMIASLVSILLVLYLPEIRYLFLVAIIPYVIDLIMILTYPNYLNDKRDTTFSLKAFFKSNIDGISYTFKTKKVRRAVFNSSTYQAFFKAIKDYVQPLVLAITGSMIIFSSLNDDEHKTIYIGIIYTVIYFISAIASRNAHHVQKMGDHQKLVQWMWLLTGLVLLILSFLLSSLWAVLGVFILLYIIMNIRKPIMIDVIGEVTKDDKRATVLSVEAQMASIMIAISAPLIGLLAEYSMQALFITLASIMVLIFILSFYPQKEKN
ncbi:MAG: MFS transporter [Acholeplasmataceae bacterium]|nr:MFS transporter [Acholeplasmataceae bacterium]